jgi:hypothetical protein
LVKLTVENELMALHAEADCALNVTELAQTSGVGVLEQGVFPAVAGSWYSPVDHSNVDVERMRTPQPMSMA